MGMFAKIMNRTAKIMLAVIACYLAYCVYVHVRYGHSMDWKTCKQYLWIFKDSVIRDLKNPDWDKFVCASDTKKRDVRNIFHYYHNKEMYIITVWEFKDLANSNLNQIAVNQNINLADIKFQSGETLSADSGLPVAVKHGFAFHNGININLDSSSEIYGTFEGANYKGFYGAVNKMSFSDEKSKPQILFDYSPKPYKTPVPNIVFLVYKGHQSFYVIIINSEKPFKDASIINILNLE